MSNDAIIELLLLDFVRTAGACHVLHSIHAVNCIVAAWSVLDLRSEIGLATLFLTGKC